MKTFYKNTNLDYGQYKGPHNTDEKVVLKHLPESYLKNIYVYLDDSKNNLISLEDFRENEIKEFENKNSVKIDKKFLCQNKRCVLQPVTTTEFEKGLKPQGIIKIIKNRSIRMLFRES